MDPTLPVGGPNTAATSADLEPPEMTFSSSPVFYPQSSSPPPLPTKKRKLFKTYSAQEQPAKKVRPDETLVTIVDGPVPEELEDVSYSVCKKLQEVHDGPVLSNSSEDHHTASISTISEPVSTTLSATIREPLRVDSIEIQTCMGSRTKIGLRRKHDSQSYEQLIAQRSVTAAGRAKKAYYGVEIHKLMDEAKVQRELDQSAREHQEQQLAVPSIEQTGPAQCSNGKNSPVQQMWTEKYRAKKFTELVGDERTHRSVLKWLKAWDSIVFPGSAKAKPKRIFEDGDAEQGYQQRKVLLLTGPPGLGKTTLAHVCAKQAGYEVLEINASDDRSRDVVKGRIKDALGTETVRGIKETGKARKAGRPVCVVVDEVDGVVTGSGAGGEGGFVKALIDLVQLDQKNSSQPSSASTTRTGKKKGDTFRLLRPLILICNDVYAPSLRPLRSSSVAEIVHVRKPPIDKVIARLKLVFEKEQIPCDNDAVRRLCESSWGLGTRKQNSVASRGAGEGDIRGVLVQGEWAAHKLRAAALDDFRLTRKWVEGHIGSAQSATDQRGLGRGGVREVVERVFIEGAGLPNLPTSLSAEEARLIADSKRNPIGVADLRKRKAINSLREMIDTCGEHDRLMTDCFATYPTQVFQDDTFLSKPNCSYDWLHFHDSLSSRVFTGQEWELNPYLSSSACAFHHLFSTVDQGRSGWNEAEKQDAEGSDETHPFSGPKADFAAYEAEKENGTVLTELRSNFSAPMLRLFSSVDTIATELLPCIGQMMAPDVKPVVVGGSGGGASVASVRKESERNCIQYSVRAMTALGIEFEKVRIETETMGGANTHSGYALRMEPPIDSLTSFHFDKPASTSASASKSTYTPTAPVRYAVRQVLDQELRKEKLLQASIARQARVTKAVNASTIHGIKSNQDTSGEDADGDKENTDPASRQIKDPKQTPLVAAATVVKRDFFGRPIVNLAAPASISASGDIEAIAKSTARKGKATTADGPGPGSEGSRVWVSFHEGFSNAVRKPITLAELMNSF